MAAYKILLVDDNKHRDGFFEPLADLAFTYLKANLEQAETFDKMRELMDENPYEYQGLILDGKGQKSEKSKTEDDGFLSVALKWIREKSRDGVYLPYVIYSGFADELRKYYDEEPIFWKGKSEEKNMFEFLRIKIESGEYFRHKQLCPEIFEMLDFKLIPSKYQPDLVNAAQVFSDTYSGDALKVLRGLRPMLEATIKRLGAFDSLLISEKYLRTGYLNLTGALRYLAGSPSYNKETDKLEFHSDRVMPMAIYYLADTLKNVTSDSAIHDSEEYSSKYLVKACVNSFFGYCAWYKKFVEKNYLK